MKLLIKKIALITLLLSAYTTTFCQKRNINEEEFYKNRAFDGDTFIDTTHATPQQMAGVRRVLKAKLLKNDHYYFNWPAGNVGVRFVKTDASKSEIYEGLNWGPYGLYNTVLIAGNCGVEFAALDVTESNAANYRYHVVQNDQKELITWTTPSVFKHTADGKSTYAYLGKFAYVPGQVLKVEIYPLNNYRQLDAMMIDWRKVEAATLMGTIDFYAASWHQPDNGLFSKKITDLQQTTEKVFYRRQVNGKEGLVDRPISVKDFIETTDKNDIKFRADDSVRNLSFIIQNGKRSYNYKVNLKRNAGGQTDSINLGEVNDRFNLNKEFWKTPGKYEIVFTPKIHRHGGEPIYLLRNLAAGYSFTVLPALDARHDIPLKTVIAIVLVLMTATAINLAFLKRRHKHKIALEAQSKQIATLQLQSVRAQLNPHFIFNALAGIQNLMNKNAIGDANKYLARFARLTRNVLDDGQKELVPIMQEAALLDDYLQMEQTRFGFKFTIDVNANVNQQTEIPAMLLQPFVENAIKHGISALKSEGLVTVGIAKSGENLILSVNDNGKGFSTRQPGGKGIQLCEERIKLLNDIYKDTPILLDIKSGKSGTFITIELKNWL